MSTFDDESRAAAHNACGDAIRHLHNLSLVSDFGVAQAIVDWDGTKVLLTVVAQLNPLDEVGFYVGPWPPRVPRP